MNELEKIHLDVLVSTSDALFKAKNRDELFAAIKSGCNGLGFDQFTLSCNKKNSREMILNSTMTMMCPDFIDEYDRLNWSDEDIFADRFVSGERSVSWNSITDQFKYTDERNYLGFLRENHLISGILAAPASRPGILNMLSFTSSDNKTIHPETVHAVEILANYAIQKAEILGLSKEVATNEAMEKFTLSNTQIEILKWISEGKSNSDIATILGLTDRNTRYHTNQILQKLGVRTRTQAAVIFKHDKFKNYETIN
jgi:LuxR family transcriptional regulator